MDAHQLDSALPGLGIFLGTLNPQMVDADIAKLEEYYKLFGYLDAHVSRELHWNEDGQTLTLSFHVQEACVTRSRIGRTSAGPRRCRSSSWSRT